MSTKKVKGAVTGPALQSQVRFNESSCGDKISETGFDYFGGSSVILGALNAAVAVPQFRPVLIVNTGGALAYVALSDDPLMAAPATGADGIPLAPDGGRIVLATGENTYIRASAATVFGFIADDNVMPDGE